MMSVLDRHPGPWRLGSPQPGSTMVIDSAGVELVKGTTDPISEVEDLRFASPEVERIILAAPELLAALKGIVAIADRDTVPFVAARAIIARIEGQG